MHDDTAAARTPHSGRMRIHHLNCISTCPLGGHLMDGRTPGVLTRGQLACHCLLLETDQGLVLVDTGLGLGDVAHPRRACRSSSWPCSIPTSARR
jgi:hypothetical protein